MEIVKELLESRHVDVNQEAGKTSDAYQGGSVQGLTALDLAAIREGHPPPEIKRGGRRAEKQWRADMFTIGRLLVSKGARSGSKASISTTARELAFDPNANISIFLVGEELLPETRSTWPYKLPTNDRSRAPPDADSLRGMMMAQSIIPGSTFGRTTINAPVDRTTFSGPEWSQSQIEKCRGQADLIKSHWRRLPVGWDVAKISVSGDRVYYIDHNNRTTTWEEPQQSSEASETS